MDFEQDPQQEIEMQDHLKQLRAKESPTAWKSSKTAKALEKESMDNSQLASNVTTSALLELITEQTTVVGEIRVQLHALEEWPQGWVNW